MSFAFAGEVELESGLGLRVHEVAGVDLSDAGAADTDYVVGGFFRDRHEMGVGHVYGLFAYDEMDRKSIAFKRVLYWNCAKNQKYCTTYYQNAGEDCYSHDSFHR